MSTSEFVFTHKMGIGGIVLEDKEERDVIFRIPLGERRRTVLLLLVEEYKEEESDDENFPDGEGKIPSARIERRRRHRQAIRTRSIQTVAEILTYRNDVNV